MQKKYNDLDALSKEEVAEFRFAGKYELSAGNASNAIIAEGDSWFDYLPGTDIVDCLRYYHHFYVENHSKGGDTLENMVYGNGYDGDFSPTKPAIDVVLKRIADQKPKAFLFSGGGNDIAGSELDNYLNHAESGLPPFREESFELLVDVCFRKYYLDLIERVGKASPGTAIITHGYGHTIPTGVGVQFFGYNFVGPWLLPSFAKKRILDQEEQRWISFALIDRFNVMLAQLSAENPRFVHLDLRGDIDPKKDWANELHLRNSAYKRVADRFAEAIGKL